MWTRALGLVLLLAAGLLGCETLLLPPPRPPVEPPPAPAPTPEPRRTDPLAVHREPEPVLVAAWAEPPHLQPGGGQAHILIRVQRRGGAPAESVEVRLQTSKGSLYSAGRILRTAGNGQTRDLLTTKRTAVVTLNAGGTRYSFIVPVLPRDAATPEESSPVH